MNAIRWSWTASFLAGLHRFGVFWSYFRLLFTLLNKKQIVFFFKSSKTTNAITTFVLTTHLDGLGFNDGLLSRCLGDFLSWCWLSLLSSGCRFASFGFLKLLKKERESYELIVNSQSYRNSNRIKETNLMAVNGTENIVCRLESNRNSINPI